jgi:hypothetical protein
MRQYTCIELDLQAALVLRECMRPLARVDPYEQRSMIRFCEKLYAAILKLQSEEETQSVNVPLEVHEVFFINHFVGNEDWQGAMPLLQQTWLALYELQHEGTYPRPREEIGATLKRLAARPDGETTAGTAAGAA